MQQCTHQNDMEISLIPVIIYTKGNELFVYLSQLKEKRITAECERAYILVNGEWQVNRVKGQRTR
jgi:hypothetical protein